MYDLAILVVDDDRITSSILSRMLSKHAAKILVADDGAEGLQLFQKHHPEIVLSDINMPRMNGLEMVEQIRKMDENVKIAIFTNFEKREVLIKAIQFGVNQFFSKPFEVENFSQVIRHMCEDVIAKRKIQAELIRQKNVLQAINAMATNFLQHTDWENALTQEMLRLKTAAEISALFIYQNEGHDGEPLLANKIIALHNDPRAKARDQIHYKKNQMMRWQKQLASGGHVAGSLMDFDISKQKMLQAYKIHSILMTPIFVDDYWWGFLGIGDQHPRSFRPSDVEMLSTVVSIIGSAINNQQNRRSLEMSAAVYRHTMDGVLITDADNYIVQTNDAFTSITGYSGKEVLGRDPKLLKSGTHDRLFYSQMWEQLLNKGYWQGEITNRNKSGEIYIEWLTINCIRDKQGQVTNYIGVFSDVTRERRDAQNHAYLATHDPLTGLSNRLLLSDRLEHAINHARRFDTCIAVLFCDLDNFKPINDTYGHAAGDEILKAVALRLKHTLRSEDTICRFGGDEFVILVEELRDFAYLEKIVQKVMAITNDPISINETRVPIDMSVGVAVYPDDAQDADGLIKQADNAMYVAKGSGKHRASFVQSEPEAYTHLEHQGEAIEHRTE